MTRTTRRRLLALKNEREGGAPTRVAAGRVGLPAAGTSSSDRRGEDDADSPTHHVSEKEKLETNFKIPLGNASKEQTNPDSGEERKTHREATGVDGGFGGAARKESLSLAVKKDGFDLLYVNFTKLSTRNCDLDCPFSRHHSVKSRAQLRCSCGCILSSFKKKIGL
ncbi:unnamed protein product [Citrullus colocynthis]|uniref:Uncharacterized protein n=1 Tax=Citrullus colocynthis TaxID=252529 RepID=A0ABP0XWA8_9ROSI